MPTRDLIAVDAKSRVRPRCPKRLERGPRRLDEDDRPSRRSRDRVEARAAGFGDSVDQPDVEEICGKVHDRRVGDEEPLSRVAAVTATSSGDSRCVGVEPQIERVQVPLIRGRRSTDGAGGTLAVNIATRFAGSLVTKM